MNFPAGPIAAPLYSAEATERRLWLRKPRILSPWAPPTNRSALKLEPKALLKVKSLTPSWLMSIEKLGQSVWNWMLAGVKMMSALAGDAVASSPAAAAPAVVA